MRPNCGHFFGGVYWYGLETAGPSAMMAIVSTSPEYDEAATGYSRKQLREAAIKGLRYLCFTHDTGPADCVRPKESLGRPEPANTKWGERGKGFFPESQCSGTIHNLNIIAALLPDMIDAETWQMLANINMDYMERFGTMSPPSGVYNNTQMEENGWTGLGLASACLLLPRHPQAEAWARHAARWMFDTATMPQDSFNQTVARGRQDGGRALRPHLHHASRRHGRKPRDSPSELPLVGRELHGVDALSCTPCSDRPRRRISSGTGSTSMTVSRRRAITWGSPTGCRGWTGPISTPAPPASTPWPAFSSTTV